jgi:RND superfamily putative drug exporter
MTTLTRWVLRHGRLVALAWVLLTLGGLFSVTQIGDALSQRFDAPGREGFEANQQILKRTGAGGSLTPMVLVGDREQVEQVADAVRGGRLVLDAPREGVALLYPPRPPSGTDENPQAIAAATKAAKEAGVGITGVEVLSDSGRSSGPGLLVETLAGAAAALAILAWVFASALALVPLFLAAIAILTTFLLLFGLAQVTEVSFVVQFLVGLIGLGVAIDYSLLIVTRWREERARDPDGAIERAMATAGRAVVLSGTTVAIGLLALVVVPVPAIRSIGFGGLLIPLVSVAATITLLPLILRRFGPRLERRAARRRGTGASRGWTAWSRRLVAHPWPAAIVGLAVLCALAAAALSLRPGDPTVDALATSGPAQRTLTQLEDRGVGAGVLTPIEVVSTPDEAEALAERLGQVEGVAAARADDRNGLVDVIPTADTARDEGGATLDRVRDAAGDALVGGPAAQTQDITDAIYAAFPWMVALIVLLTLLLLARALRSVLLPIKAVLLNALSIAAAWGIVVLLWQQGGLSDAIWGIPATDAITNWIPLAIFAFLYGLSMDYEVFILTRVREGYDESGSTSEAVVIGLGRTGRLVTSAALILFFAFAALAASPGTEIKILATGLAAGILLDATVVRALVVPALVILFGRANWWWPFERRESRETAPS